MAKACPQLTKNIAKQLKPEKNQWFFRKFSASNYWHAVKFSHPSARIAQFYLRNAVITRVNETGVSPKVSAAY